jgi:hypothetical protein
MVPNRHFFQINNNAAVGLVDVHVAIEITILRFEANPLSHYKYDITSTVAAKVLLFWTRQFTDAAVGNNTILN